jgi:aspartyl-tRNA synthetase
MPRDKFNSHQEIKARGFVSRLMKSGVLYKRLRDASVISGRQDINSDQLAARNSVGDVLGEFIVESTEAVDNRRKHQRNLVRGVPEVRTETMARDGVADDFVAALLKARLVDIIPEDLTSSLASRAYHDLD